MEGEARVLEIGCGREFGVRRSFTALHPAPPGPCATISSARALVKKLDRFLSPR
jgi:hypothetical protein